MSTFRFQSPLVLLLLIPVIVVTVISLYRRRPAVLYSSTELLRELPVTFAQRLRRLLPWFRLLGLIVMTFALARPQLGREETRIRTEGIAIQMCVDKSGSMRAMDFELKGKQVDRLTVVKDVFREFVSGDEDFAGRQDDLVGLISFGGYATAVCPLTLDHGALLEVLETVTIPEPIYDENRNIINRKMLMEEQATAIGDALALSVARLKDAESTSKVVVLLSDGANTAGVISPIDAAEAALEFGIKVYCIGIGSSGFAPFPMQDRSGEVFLQQQRVELDESTLKAIAEKTNGQYFNARNTGALKQVYAEIDKLEKTEIEGRLYTEYREVFGYPMFAGLCCVFGAMILGTTWLRGLP